MPQELSTLQLENVKYRDSDLNINVEGRGRKVKVLMLNGVKVKGNTLTNLPKGENRIKIILN